MILSDMITVEYTEGTLGSGSCMNRTPTPNKMEDPDGLLQLRARIGTRDGGRKSPHPGITKRKFGMNENLK